MILIYALGVAMAAMVAVVGASFAIGGLIAFLILYPVLRPVGRRYLAWRRARIDAWDPEDRARRIARLRGYGPPE